MPKSNPAGDLEEALNVLEQVARQLKMSTVNERGRTLVETSAITRAAEVLAKHGRDAEYLRRQ